MAVHAKKKIKLMSEYVLLDLDFDADSICLGGSGLVPALETQAGYTHINRNLFFNFCLYDDQHIRMPGFYETWIEKYMECDFYKHFRMNRNTLEQLQYQIIMHLRKKVYVGGPNQPIPEEKSILVTIWYLAKGCTLETVGDRFNIAVKSVYFAVSEVLEAIESLMASIIKWPSLVESREIENEFKNVAGFPGIIGDIDGCHFKVKVPLKQHDSYQDRKFQHSITLQGICKRNLQFINISAGYPGSLHDARILKESNIFKQIEMYGPGELFYDKYCLLGDSAYPCKTWLMTPYRIAATHRQRNYNRILSKTRVFIENSFGLLKSRWKILDFINVYSIKRAVKIITSCCVLHNFCIENNDMFDYEVLNNYEDQDFYFVSDDVDGTDKRNRISAFLD